MKALSDKNRVRILMQARWRRALRLRSHGRAQGGSVAALLVGDVELIAHYHH